MGGTESSTGAVIRNGDWEHRFCWSESQTSIATNVPSRDKHTGNADRSDANRYTICMRQQINVSNNNCSEKIETSRS